MKNKPTFLYLDDEPENLSTLRRLVFDEYEVETALTPKEAFEKLKKKSIDVVVSDQRMPEKTGVDFLKEAFEQGLFRIGIVLTAYSDMDALVDGINSGVIFRYLPKPINESHLKHALKQAFEKISLEDENKYLLEKLRTTNRFLKEEIDENYDFSILSGADQGLEPLVNLIRKVAPTDSTVLVRGESGVGKELVARALHEASGRKNEAFIRVNCGGLTETLLESTLFGYEKGAFTGADKQQIGKFEAASGGTLFLDEIGDISPKLQVDLLRVIQERQFERVGGNETIEVDIRIIAATHQNLEALCEKKLFREDLFYRLNVFPLTVPPLRERPGDIEKLAARLIQKASKVTKSEALPLSAEALKKLKNYDWPGNVRELENTLERALILSAGGEILDTDIHIQNHQASNPAPTADKKELSAEQIQEALLECKGNKVKAAAKLGIKRPTLYYQMKKFGLE